MRTGMQVTANIDVQHKIEGQPNSTYGNDFPYYRFVWTDEIAKSRGFEDSYAAVMHFKENVTPEWSGVVISRRVVCTTEWQEVDDA